MRNVADRFVFGWAERREQTTLKAKRGINAAGRLSLQVGCCERSLIAEELTRNDGAIRLPYETLGLSRKALYEKMKKYGLDRKRCKEAENGLFR